MKKSDGRDCFTECTAIPMEDLYANTWAASGRDGRMEVRTDAARGSNITALVETSGVTDPVGAAGKHPVPHT